MYLLSDRARQARHNCRLVITQVISRARVFSALRHGSLVGLCERKCLRSHSWGEIFRAHDSCEDLREFRLHLPRGMAPFGFFHPQSIIYYYGDALIVNRGKCLIITTYILLQKKNHRKFLIIFPISRPENIIFLFFYFFFLRDRKAYLSIRTIQANRLPLSTEN